MTVKLCSHVDPLDSRRRLCNGILLKTVELASGKAIFYPLMTYCYIDFHPSLQCLLLDQNFTSLCSHWKSMDTSLDKLEEVYDGRVWNNFKNVNGSPFLEDNHAYAFMINMDWFQPYKHLTYSVVVIYLTFLDQCITNYRTLNYICMSK